MDNSIMLGSWGIGRKTLIYEAPKLGLNIKKFISELGVGFSYKIMSAIEDELSRGSEQPSFSISPLSRQAMGNLDFTPFILYDKVLMDSTSYTWIVNQGQKLPITQAWSTHESISILKGLKDKGILILKNYSEILENPKQAAILRAMLYLDINDPSMKKAWLISVESWLKYLESGMGISKETDKYLESIISKLQIILDMKGRGVSANPGENWYWMYLADCLSDVNSALLVSRVLEIPILDWEDYLPFYKYKFLRALRQLDKHEDLKSLRKLFDIFVPRFNIRHVDDLLALREDKRLDAVKELIRTTKPDEIDDELVRKALSDVLKMKNKVIGFSKVVSIFTIPISFIPIWGSPLQVLTQEVAERVYQKYINKEYVWQCFFVDIYTNYRHSVIEDRLQSAYPMGRNMNIE